VGNAAAVFDQRDEDGVVVLLNEEPVGRAGRERPARRSGLSAHAIEVEE